MDVQENKFFFVPLLKIMRVVVRPAMLYEATCWSVQNFHAQKMKISKMGMLRWMCKHTTRDIIRNEIILYKVRVTSVDDKMKEARLSDDTYMSQGDAHMSVLARRC